MLNKEYLILFNAISDAIAILKDAQAKAEEIIISNRPEEESQNGSER